MLLFMLADGGFDPSQLTAPLSAIGSIGFAVWYAYYVTTVAMPKILDSHKAERDEARRDFLAATHDLLVEMKEQRQQFNSWMADRRTVSQ